MQGEGVAFIRPVDIFGGEKSMLLPGSHHLF